MYCLKCKKETGTTNQREGKTRNRRRILKGKCSVCNTNKAKFI